MSIRKFFGAARNKKNSLRESQQSARRNSLRKRLLGHEKLEDRRLLAAIRLLPGFDGQLLAENDDASTQLTSLGFDINFFGESYNELYVNNNGNVTFDNPLNDFTPDELEVLGEPIIAPFWADVDTRGIGSGEVSYGTDTVDGRPAFGVNWIGVGYFDINDTPINSFQLVLIDRSDIEAGAFDVEFNYDTINWESGDADGGIDGLGGIAPRAGFSDGTMEPGTSYELIGSGENGAFLDSNLSSGLVNNSLRSYEAGRYVFEVRAGSPLNELGLVGQATDLGNGVLFLGEGTHPYLLPNQELPTNGNSIDTSDAELVIPGGSFSTNLTGAGVTVGVVEARDFASNTFDAAGNNGVRAAPTPSIRSGFVRTTHNDFGGRVTTPGATPTFFGRHATHVAATIGGNGPAGRGGFAPGVNIQSFQIGNFPLGISQAQAAGIDLTNHSYGFSTGWGNRPVESSIVANNVNNTVPGDLNGDGDATDNVDVYFADRATGTEDPRFGVYSTNDATRDAFLASNPNLLSVWSAGNDRGNAFANALGNNSYVTWFTGGFGGIATNGWYLVPATGNAASVAPGSDGNNGAGFDSVAFGHTMKNALVVGAINDVLLESGDPNYAATLTTNLTTAFSSYGPLDDGRLGVDVVANGASLVSANASSNTAQATLSGTSMAAPSVTGVAALLLEHYRNQANLPGSNLPDASPTSATQKGILIHTAQDTFTPGPDYVTGYGVVQADEGVNFISNAAQTNVASGRRDRLVEDVFMSGQPNKTYTFNASQGRDVKTTLVWTDVAGTGQATNVTTIPVDNNVAALVNNLNMTVTAPDGTVFQPWTLNPTTPNVAATRGANNVENVEQVSFTPTQTGVYTITVAGTLGSGTSQNFSLLTSTTGPQSVITADDDAPNSASGDGVADNFRIVQNGQNVEVYVNGNIVFNELEASMTGLTIRGSSDNDTLTVDVSGGLIPLANNIRFEGNDGFDALNVNDSVVPLTAFASEAINLGSLPGDGTHTLDGQTIEFFGLEPINTNVAVANFTIGSQPGLASLLQDDNQINYSTGVTNGPTWGRVTVDNFEPIEFTNKTNLVMNAGSGDDEINLNYQNPGTVAPTGLTGTITVNGGDPTASDELIVNATAGVFDGHIVRPTSQGAGTIGSLAVAPPPLIVYSGIEDLTLVSQTSSADRDAVRIAGTAGIDDFAFTPGANATEGMITGIMDQGNATGSGQFELPTIRYQGVETSTGAIAGQARGVGINNDAATQGGSDTIIYNGTSGNDVFTVFEESVFLTFNNDNVALGASLTTGTLTATSTNQIIINAGNGDDRIQMRSATDATLSYDLNGGNPDSGSDTLTLVDPGAVQAIVIFPDAVDPTQQDIAGYSANASPIDTTGIELISYLGAGGDDTLNVNSNDAGTTARVNAGPSTTANPQVTFDRVTSDFLPTIDFAGLLNFTLTSNDIINSTPGADKVFTFVTGQLSGATNYQAALERRGAGAQDTLVIEGSDGGADNFTISDADGIFNVNGFAVTDNVAGVTVTEIGGNPAHLRINTLGNNDVVNVNVGGGGDLISTPITYDGGNGSDLLQVFGTPTATTTVTAVNYTPGPDLHSGKLRYDTAPGPGLGQGVMNIEFSNLEPVNDLVPSATLVVNAPNSENAITYTAGPNTGNPAAPFNGVLTGQVAVDGFETIEFANKVNLTLNGNSGPDTVVLNNPARPTGLATYTVNTANGDDIITAVSLPPVAVGFMGLTVNAGAGNDLVDASSLFQAAAVTEGVVLNGGPGNDDLRAGSGTNVLNGGTGDDLLTTEPTFGTTTHNGGTGFDTIIVNGTPFNDAISVTQNAPTGGVGANYSLAVRMNQAALNFNDFITSTNPALTPANPANRPTVEAVRIVGGLGNDQIVVAHADAYVDATGTGAAPVETTANGSAVQMLRFDVRGDGPNSSDRLTVLDLGAGDLVLHRQGVDERTGRVTIAPAVNATATTVLRPASGIATAFLGDVVYSGIENVDISPVNPLTGGTGNNGLGRVVVFDSDPFEQNDNILVATDFGDFDKVTRDPNIDPANNSANGAVPVGNGDEDWYSFTAAQDGTFQINTLFTTLSVAQTGGRPGLPGNGVLASAVYTTIGAATPLTVSSPLNDALGNTIGSQLQFAGNEGQTYYFRVTGGPLPAAVTSASTAINNYDLTLAQIDDVGPQVTGVTITGSPGFNLFANKPGNATAGPTPAVNSLTISFRDLVSATQSGSAPGGVLGALDPATALAPGNYQLVGDQSGPIQINNIAFATPPTPITVASTVAGTAGTNTFVGGAGLNPIPNFYVGQAVQFTNGPASGQARVITAYTGGAAPIFTFDAPFTVAPVVGDAFNILPSLPVPVPSAVTAATSATSFSGTALLSAINGFYVGQVLQFTGGVLSGEAQVITAYNGATKTFTVENPFSTTPVVAGATTFNILPNPVTAITIRFASPLPDDRFTLTVLESVTDPAGNNLDGESNAAEPNGAPTFASGDTKSGGDFVARFTVDSRPEVATWSQGVVYVDTNGNFLWDPEGQDNDAINRDFVYHFGNTTDAYFAGNFAPTAAAAASGYDKVGSFGRFNGQYRFFLDTNDDGVGDTPGSMFFQTNVVPVAGNFSASHPGDEIGGFDGQNWYLDINGNNQIDSTERFASNLRGIPVVGDFNGDGFDDLATFNNETGVFSFDLDRNGTVDDQLTYFFSGFGEKPVAGDVNLDGIDDIVLWVPNREGQLPDQAGEFHYLVSDNVPVFAPNPPAAAVITALPSTVFNAYSPFPLGNDLFAQFGDEFALPLLGNFDPPVAEVEPLDTTGWFTNASIATDVNNDGRVDPSDALAVINALNRGITSADPGQAIRVLDSFGGNFYDVDADGVVAPYDALLVINALNFAQRQLAGGQGEDISQSAASFGAAVDIVFSSDDDDDELLLDFADNDALRNTL